MGTRYPNIPAIRRPWNVKVLASFWAAWVKDFTATFGVGTAMINDPGAPNSVKTTYGYRQFKGAFNAVPGWYLLNSGNDAEEQTRADDYLRLLSLAHLIDFQLWYPPASEVTSGVVPDQSQIWEAGIGRHLSSVAKNNVPLCVVLQDFWWSYDANTPHTWLNENNFASGLVALISDPCYLKVTEQGIANRPVIGLFRAGTVNWDVGHLGTLTTAITNAGFGTPIYIQMNADVTVSNTLNCRYLTAYGPSGAMPAGAGHVAYSAQITKSVSVDTLASLNAARCLTLVHNNDNRPRPSGYTANTDAPINSQWIQHLKDRYALARSAIDFDPSALSHQYSVGEWDEGGDWPPTLQSVVRGVNTPSYGPYVDGFVCVLNESVPATYQDHYHARSLHADLSAVPAGWALVQNLWDSVPGSATGALEYSELQNSTTTNARTLTFVGTRAQVYGGMRPGLGTMRFVVNGGANNDVNQGVLVGTGFNQLIFDTGVLALGTHTLSAARVSGTCGYDEWVVFKVAS